MRRTRSAPTGMTPLYIKVMGSSLGSRRCSSFSASSEFEAWYGSRRVVGHYMTPFVACICKPNKASQA